MRLFKWSEVVVAVSLASILVLTGCEKGGGGGGGGDLGDVGANNANVYVALGDSVTDGNNGGGAPYPPRLAAMTGKTVINHAGQGQSAAQSAGGLGGILSGDKPAAVLFSMGAVDIIGGRSVDDVIASLASVIHQAKANKSVPVIGTLPPMLYSHARFNGVVQSLNDAIRNLASSEGVRLADVAAKFGSGDGLIIDDGLHPNEQGNQLMAEAFNDAL